MKFSFIHAEKGHLPVAAWCRILGVMRQGYYAFANRKPSKRDREAAELETLVVKAHEASRHTCGCPRIYQEFKNQGFAFGKRRIERTMHSLGIFGRKPRKYRITTVADRAFKHSGNILSRDFHAAAPNQRWVTDITYIQTGEGWCYLATILDLFSRAVVGWALSTSLETTLPLAALDMALLLRLPSQGLLHHSYRGCQYISEAYQAILKGRGITISMSRKGNCWDDPWKYPKGYNAVAESFFSTLKTELIDRKPWATREQLRVALFDYIEVFYNRQRLHSAIGYKSPMQLEAGFAATAAT